MGPSLGIDVDRSKQAIYHIGILVADERFVECCHGRFPRESRALRTKALRLADDVRKLATACQLLLVLASRIAHLAHVRKKCLQLFCVNIYYLTIPVSCLLHVEITFWDSATGKDSERPEFIEHDMSLRNGDASEGQFA